MITCHRQIQVLKHERELSINGKLFLYKDHHRRLFHVLTSTVCNNSNKTIGVYAGVIVSPLIEQVSQICLVVWIALTLPYVIQLTSLVAGLNSAMRLEEMPFPYTTVLMYMYQSLPLVNCFLLVSAFVVYFSLKLKG